MSPMQVNTPRDEPLPPDLAAKLAEHGVDARDEVGLRETLERHTSGYTLCRLTPAAARRWKALYRLMWGATYLDGQSPAEAYGRALVAILEEGGGNPDSAT